MTATKPSKPVSMRFSTIGILGVSPRPNREGVTPRVQLGEAFTFRATIFGPDRTPLRGRVMLTGPDGTDRGSIDLSSKPGDDLFTATTFLGQHSDAQPWQPEFERIRKDLGTWSFRIEAWEDTLSLWQHDARIKIGSGDDAENMFAEGATYLEHWARAKKPGLTNQERRYLRKVAHALRNQHHDDVTRLQVGLDPRLAQLNQRKPWRRHHLLSPTFYLQVERPHAVFQSTYEFFPRSEGATRLEDGTIVPGTLKTAVSGLERAKKEGFDTVYIPPIFPIGKSYRKGKDGSLTVSPTDPGSPWAIGSTEGGHDTVDPKLGTLADWKNFVSYAHKLGLEVELDFALQCSPDHPWVHQHPNWFKRKADGTVAYAENPPMKYQDIYPLYFGADLKGIEDECVAILEQWISTGVTSFRVDNPHTKPLGMWQNVIERVRQKHPEVLFLAESFTRPSLRRALADVGFDQSHCYFQWRTTKSELATYLQEVNSPAAYYEHDTFWPSTPDNMTDYLVDGGPAAFSIRAILAALGSPNWGIYSGYELCENKRLEGSAEPADNEKFEIRVRDWQKAGDIGISTMLTALNRIRHDHPGTSSYFDLTVHHSDNNNILVFSRFLPASVSPTGTKDGLIVVVNLDAHADQCSTLSLDLSALGLDPGASFTVHDELTGAAFEWNAHPWVNLNPWSEVAHILSVSYPQEQ